MKAMRESSEKRCGFGAIRGRPPHKLEATSREISLGIWRRIEN